MAVKKSELYSSLWNSCDELRGGMDASLYKDYVLTLLFVKYVTDRFAGDRYAEVEIPEGGSFLDMIAAKGKSDIGDKMNKIISKLAESNGLSGVIDVADFDDDGKLGSGQDKVDKLSNLILIFQDEKLDFRKNKAGGDDIIGDAYEYLMRNFATESGKSKGQFYTPAEVSRIIAKVIGISGATVASQTIYDPACGSGSLLIRAADEAPKGITIYGQESDSTTAGLAKMNLVLHNKSTGTIANANTLSTPKFKNGDSIERFDFAVANPPFSYKSWSNGIDTGSDERFVGYNDVPPAKNGDYAWLMHFIHSLKPQKGKGAIILPHGVLFRGNAEATIRKEIINRKIIKGIIGLPANLFYGTGIPACIIVLDKENAENRKGIFMIDASKGFVKDGNKNRLRAQDIHKIVDVFNKQLEIPKYSRMVSVVEIGKKEFNLNIPRYIDSQEAEDIQDIEAHLKGDIPTQDIEDLQNYWSVYPTLKTSLFGESKREGYSTLKIAQEEIKHTIFSHPEFTKYAKTMGATFATWKEKNTVLLKNLIVGTKPKEIIHGMSEDILATFSKTNLIDKYDIYQQLMTYWAETMQDDMYLIAVDGWKTELVVVEGKKGGMECDLVPKYLVINRYFASEKQAIEELQTKFDNASREIEELIEEHSGEDGCFTDFEKINKVSVTAQIKTIKGNIVDNEELKVMGQYLALGEQESEAKKRIKEAEKTLDAKVIAKYKKLTESEIKILVVDDKWMVTLEQAVKGEMDRISQRLTQRIKELAERYATPLPTLVTEYETLADKVNTHLKKMGFIW